MRVSLSPGPGLPELDLELGVGTTLGALREHLAEAARCPAARTAALWADGVELDDAHRTGTFPLVAGARLSVGSRSVADDDATTAVRAPWHLAVVRGPDAGALWPVGARTVVGRLAVDPLGSERSARANLTDARVSQPHLELRVAAGRVWVRDLGSANGARLARAWTKHRLGRSVPRWPVRWRPGDRVTLGDTEIELRGARPHRPPAPRARRLLLVTTALAPALASLALVAGTRNPALLAIGLAGPALAGLLAQRRPRATEPESESDRVEPRVDASELGAKLTRAVLTGGLALDADPLGALAPTGVLAVQGPGAREIVATLCLASQAARVEVHGPHAEHWRWARWLDGSRGETGPTVVVVDGTQALPEWGGPGRVLVLVDPERVPSWCTARLEASTGQWLGPDGSLEWEIRPGSPRWAEDNARRLAGARCVRELGAGGLPDAVTLGALGLPLDADAITAAWGAADGGLRALVGAGPEGRDAVVDLAREGPHALVAGTTGSGKSELLRALVASLALRYPPTALAIALVDFKGGAGFGALAHLPHVVGTVTDLDPLGAARAIGGLAAELRARKALLARVGAADLRGWPAHAPVAHPGRLVVVIDEFRALAEELPELMGALERIATQGRSLGVHLVLATQRPSGVVSAELRANVALRFALRVTDTSDSSDVIEVPDAARIPPSLPGRALLRRGPGPVEDLQVAQVGHGRAPVRVADEPVEDRGAADLDDELVAAVHAAAARWQPGAPRPGAPWLPELPAELSLAESERLAADSTAAASTVAGTTAAGTTTAEVLGSGEDRPSSAPRARQLPFGLADVPERQARELAAWDPDGGHLLAVGGPASGRSTLLETLAASALERGWAVHTVGLPDAGWLATSQHPGLGTRCGADDPRRLARLVGLLREAPARTLVLVDDVASAWLALERMARGAGVDRFGELLRSRAVAVAASSDRAAGGWVAHFPQRLVLPVGDAVTEEMAGVPRALCGARRGPGRAVLVPFRGEPVVCQVARADAPAEPSPGQSGLAISPVRLAPVPLLALRPPGTRLRRRGVPVGLGADDGREVTVPLGTGGLVVGPPGSGRSTALAQVLRAVQGAARCLTVARDPGVLEAGLVAGRGAGHDSPELGELLADAREDELVVVDDLDQLARVAPVAAELLDEHVDRGGRVLASVSLDAALGSYRGAVATLRARRVGLVLWPGQPGSGDVLGSPLDWHADPANPRHPGRGVMQVGTRIDPVQVFAPG